MKGRVTMKNIKLGKSELMVPQIVVGCMQLKKLNNSEAGNFLKTALDLGANFFDHADIYGKGECEKIFGEVLLKNQDMREKIVLQSKCGIRGDVGTYDFSKEYILKSVEGILKRLNTEYIDVLLLHRPDALMEPEEVAEAFDQLKSSGKVHNFGVSNQNPMQMELLQKYMHQPIIADQLQFSITNSNIISNGINVNMCNDSAIVRDGHVLDYCRLNDITIQAWSPFRYGFFEGIFLGSEKYPELNHKIDEIALKYDVSNTTIAAAWILRHPAKIQLISGTTTIEHLTQICKATEIELTREEWYAIYREAGNQLP